MKRTTLALIACLAATAAAAQTALNNEDIATARALIENAKQAEAAATAKDADVEAIIINLQIANAGPGGGQAIIGLVPSDPEFAQVLATIKTVAGKRKQEADDKLGALGLSRKPEAPEGGNPNN